HGALLHPGPGSLRSGLQPERAAARRHLLSGGRRRGRRGPPLGPPCAGRRERRPPGGAELRLPRGALSSAGDAGQPQVAAPGLADGALPPGAGRR
ncbi:DUF3848 domain-containing protein, partial [Dysosmobacter welbionis]